MSYNEKHPETAEKATQILDVSSRSKHKFPSELPHQQPQKAAWYERLLAMDDPETTKNANNQYEERRIWYGLVLHGHQSKLCERWFMGKQKPLRTDRHGTRYYRIEYECLTADIEKLQLEGMDLELLRVGELKREHRDGFMEMIASKNGAYSQRNWSGPCLIVRGLKAS
ncbi:hypothetical protein BDW74DRAFT_179186 [Aspergillus multicolor]|uniref:uncharacterized protein n=1 Tax=Aspergillus multicolor TaxID=41759 RepID=UPI003CCD4815